MNFLVQMKRWGALGFIIATIACIGLWAPAYVEAADAVEDNTGVPDSDPSRVLDNYFYLTRDGKLKIGMKDSSIKNKVDATNAVLARYRFAIVGVSGVGALSMILVFILNFIRLGSTSHAPNERSKIISALIYSGIASAGLGSVTLIVGLFYSLLN